MTTARTRLALAAGKPPVQLIVLAKEPVPGRVKTRLCPPHSPADAARLAAAALQDTLRVVRQVPARRRVLALDGRLPTPRGFVLRAQRGEGLDERLAHAFVGTRLEGTVSLLVGMDTPQLTPENVADALEPLLRGDADAVLGPAQDGGWWLLGLREAYDGRHLAGVPMSTALTGRYTREALQDKGLRVRDTVTLVDVDTDDDARAVAEAAAWTSFARVYRECVVPAERAS